jgi:DNA-binding response OmpR family regulator
MTTRVLIVDDEPTVIALLRDCFTSFEHGRAYEITSAGSVSEGFACLLRERFDLILLDMVIPEPARSSPGKQGLDLLKRIRAHGVNAPVLMMTGGSDTGTEVDALIAGAVGYLHKPFNLRALERSVALALNPPATGGSTANGDAIPSNDGWS